MENQRLVILNDLLVFRGGVKLERLTIRQYYQYNDSSNIPLTARSTLAASGIDTREEHQNFIE
jgi:hypothetical protein